MLMMTVFAAGIAACAMQPTTETTATDELQTTSLGDWHRVTQPIATGDPTAGDVSDSAPIEDAINPRAGCSIVQFCNAPGSDGTRCLQQGCSLGAALDECSREAPAVCGRPVCPWIFVASDGSRFLNGSCL
jgi:hypothetical protein